MNSLDRVLRGRTDDLFSVAREYENQFSAVGRAVLTRCRRDLLAVLEILSRSRLKQADALATTPWRELSAVEAATRIIFLIGRPLKASEIIRELTALEWRSRSSTTPVATLCADLEHAHWHPGLAGYAGITRFTISMRRHALADAKALINGDGGSFSG